MYNDDELWDLMESLFDDEEEYLEEGFFDKLKEKRAEKKAKKEEKRVKRMIDNSLVISENEFEKYKKEFEVVVKHAISILKKEIPGCKLKVDNVNNIKHSSNKLNDGYEIHRLALSVFNMDDDNFEKFKQKSKDDVLKNAENTYDCVDELMQDSIKRILDPIASKGFDYEQKTNKLCFIISCGVDGVERL